MAKSLALSILQGLTSPEKKVLETYLKDLSVLTTIIGKDKDFNAKGGAVMTFNDKYGGGEVRFQNKEEIIDFCTALGKLAKNIKAK